MKERPILFSATMVKAILGGRKSQTRRVVKHGQVFRLVPGGDLSREERQAVYASPFQWDHANPVHPTVDELLSCCPFGVPGDRLWVREAFQHTTDARGAAVMVYAADDSANYLLAKDGGDGDLCGVGKMVDESQWCKIKRWRPSIHMPRWASRITLEVIGVRVERLQEITLADVRAEGIPETYGDSNLVASMFPEMPPHEWDNMRFDEQWKLLWESINGPGSWSTNQWVWVVEFKRLEQP